MITPTLCLKEKQVLLLMKEQIYKLMDIPARSMKNYKELKRLCNMKSSNSKSYPKRKITIILKAQLLKCQGVCIYHLISTRKC